MILVRITFQAKYGQAGRLVQHYKEHRQEFERRFNVPTRVLTDISGAFDTVVLEQEVESVDQYQQMLQRTFADQEAMKLFGPMGELIASGRRDFYTIELESQKQ